MWQAPCLFTRFGGNFRQPNVPAGEIKAAEFAWGKVLVARSSSEPRLQNVALDAFLSSRFSSDILRAHFVSRVARLVGQIDAHLLADSWCELAMRAKPHLLQCVLRTLLNGWPTTSRLHAKTSRTCVFGCVGEQDSLISHYWSGCSVLFDLLSFAWGHRVPPSCFCKNWGCTVRLDLVASMYTFYAGVARSADRSPNVLRDLAIAARAAHSKQ